MGILLKLYIYKLSIIYHIINMERIYLLIRADDGGNVVLVRAFPGKAAAQDRCVDSLN
jgi:hypothetical protein